MSWLDFPPCDIISSLNTINAAIIERNSYMSPSTDTDYYRFDFLPRPCSKFAVLGKMRDTLYNLKILYQEHFPVKNFGCWGHWRPYENVEGISLENAIAAELTEVGINSNAVLLKYPMRYSDVDFVRGCYYLLNNVLLYSTYNIGALRGQHLHREWSSEEAYDRENPSVDEIVENLVDGHGCVGMSGYYKSSLNSDINTHFIQYYTNGKYIYAPELRGDWKAHYTVQIYKYLSYPRYDDVQIYGEKYETFYFWN